MSDGLGSLVSSLGPYAAFGGLAIYIIVRLTKWIEDCRKKHDEHIERQFKKDEATTAALSAINETLNRAGNRR